MNITENIGIGGVILIIILFCVGCIEDDKSHLQNTSQKNTTKADTLPTQSMQTSKSFVPMFVPMNVNLSVDENLQLNQEARLVFTVTPIVNVNGAPNTTIQIALPDEFKLISGEIFWKGDINKDETVKLECIIKPIKEGFYIIKATAISNQSRKYAPYVFGKFDALYINISKDNVTISHNDPEHKRARQNITYAQRINNSVIHEREIKNSTAPLPARPSGS